ncbi:hypothetical protein [Rhodopila sp.]|uniref:hypothetical protein n=1 Tax=Rhodopila sp. TaxID=2480087 RepID=UPI003D13ED00
MRRDLAPLRDGLRLAPTALLTLCGVIAWVLHSRQSATPLSQPAAVARRPWARVAPWGAWIGQIATIATVAATIATVAVLFWQANNTQRSRFDTFNLDTLKLQLDAAADLMTSVDQVTSSSASTLNDVTNLNALVIRITADRLNQTHLSEPQRTLLALQYTQAVAIASSEFSTFQSLVGNVPKQANRFLLVIPAGVQGAVIPHLPFLKEEIATLATLNAVMRVGTQALADVDAGGIQATLNFLVGFNDRLKAAETDLAAKSIIWNRAEARLICAFQVAEGNRRNLDQLPADCAKLPDRSGQPRRDGG